VYIYIYTTIYNLTIGAENESKYDLAYKKPFSVLEKDTKSCKKSWKKDLCSVTCLYLQLAVEVSSKWTFSRFELSLKDNRICRVQRLLKVAKNIISKGNSCYTDTLTIWRRSSDRCI